MKNKKIALIVLTLVIGGALTTSVMGGSFPALGVTQTAAAATTAKDVNILPYKISEELSQKIEKASNSEKFPVIVHFDKSLNEEGYVKLEEQIGKFSKTQTYDGVINGFAAELTKGQILQLNNIAFVSLIDSDGLVSVMDDKKSSSVAECGTVGVVMKESNLPDGSKKILLKGKKITNSSYDYISLVIQKNTPIIGTKDYKPLTMESVKKGAKIYAYYGPEVRESYPPDGDAAVILVEKK